MCCSSATIISCVVIILRFYFSSLQCEAEHDPHHKSGSGKKKKSGLGSMFEKRSTPKMSKLKVRLHTASVNPLRLQAGKNSTDKG